MRSLRSEHNASGAAVVIRRAERSDAEAAYRVTGTALLVPSLNATMLAERMEGWDSGRSWVALEGPDIVGHARALDLETTVPGGARLPTAGVSSVGVLPTHRRQGVLRAMKRAMLAEERAGGAVLASLRASQASIYGRFGYGLAGLYADYEIDATSAFRADLPEVLHRVRLLLPSDARTVVPEIFERVGRNHVGAIGRLEHWWRRLYGPMAESDASLTRWVVRSVDAEGVTDGYADLTLEESPGEDFTRRRLAVTDLYAGNDASYQALWTHIFGVDLVGTIVARQRPIDERLRWLLEDPRALRTTAVRDEQWIRLLDVLAALRARSYNPAPPAVIVDIHDELFAANAGRYRIGGRTEQGAEIVADDRARPELRMGIAEIGAMYLGGTRAVDLTGVGRVVELSAGAALRLDDVFRVPVAPWCGTFF